MKCCTDCKQCKPRSEFHRNKAASDGLCNRCKPCNCAHVAKARAADPERTRQQKRADYEKHREKRLQTVHRYNVANRDARLAAKREHYLKNKDVAAEKQRAYYLQNADRIKQKNAEWAQAHKQRCLEIKAAWHRANPWVKPALDARRRAAEKQATPAWANQFFISEAYRLAKLREQLCGGTWHVDHIVPLQGKTVCGLHVEHNLQVIPGAENMQKSNRLWPDMP